VVDKPAAMNRAPLVQSLFETIKDKAGVGCASGAPVDDPAGEGINDERDVDKALPVRHVVNTRDEFGGYKKEMVRECRYKFRYTI